MKKCTIGWFSKIVTFLVFMIFFVPLTGVMHRIGAKTQEEFKRDAERVFEQYQKYRETYPNSIQPKPEGDCIVCPDCQGRGRQLKKIPLLKVDVGKVCKTCGGSGYVPVLLFTAGRESPFMHAV